MLNSLRLYTSFLMRNPTTGLIFIGVKMLVGTMVYQEIREKLRNQGMLLAQPR